VDAAASARKELSQGDLIVSGSWRADERRYADGEVVWSWHPLLMLSARGGTLSPTGI
jgi:hypothetical protein